MRRAAVAALAAVVVPVVVDEAAAQSDDETPANGLALGSSDQLEEKETCPTGPCLMRVKTWLQSC